MPVKPVPDGYHTVSPYIVSDDPDRLLKFIREAFAGEEVHVMRQRDGRILHAQARIGDSIVMMGGADSKWPAEKTSLYLYLEDVDATYRSALDAGAASIMPPADQIYGDRMGGVKDPTGNTWWLASHVEDVTPEMMKERMKQRAQAGGR